MVQKADSKVLRGALALGGILLWIAYPFAYTEGSIDRHHYRCDGLVPETPGCFRDGLPVEFLAFPLTLILLYPFVRFTLVAFAPRTDSRSRFWGSAGSNYFPVVQVLAGLGMVWALLHAAQFPRETRFLLYFAYWAAWLLWFAAAILVSWPSARPEDRSAPADH